MDIITLGLIVLVPFALIRALVLDTVEAVKAEPVKPESEKPKDWQYPAKDKVECPPLCTWETLLSIVFLIIFVLGVWKFIELFTTIVEIRIHL